MMIRKELLILVPEVLRARGWRLYTGKGRLVDLWQYGGRAILGHNPPGLLRAFKNSAERGLYAPYPHFAEGRFHKALSTLLPGRVFRIYENEASRANALAGAGLGEAQRSFTLGGTTIAGPVLWRPFLDAETQTAFRSTTILLPVLPCPFPGAPAVLALAMQNAADTAEKIPPSQILSPITLAAATRCIYDLLAVPARGSPRFPKIDKALKNNKTWKRQGIYLIYKDVINEQGQAAKESYNDYTALFTRFLEAGFLLPPTPEDPAILPGELSPGEEAKLAGLVLCNT